MRSLSKELYRVDHKYAKKPSGSIKNIDEKLGPAWMQHIREDYGEEFSFSSDYHNLPRDAFMGFSFDELCKLRYSTPIMMDGSVEKLFETSACHEVVRKIKSSMWRWGCGTGTWNEIVDAYEGVRRFTFTDDPDFEIRLDHTTYFNEFGYAKYSRIFLDGVFAYLVYYKGVHALTIGFSILEKKQLLIQQVQSAKRTGNRYLYRLPKNRLEFVIDLFRASFPGFRLYVIDGQCLVEKTLADYRRGLLSAEKHCERYRHNLGRCDDAKRLLEKNEKEREMFAAKISHLETDGPRLASFYRDAGRFTLGSAKKINGLTHYEVRLSRSSKKIAA